MKGLRVLLEKQVDVVVARMELSGLDGTKLLPALKEHPASAAVPLVFLTTHDDVSRRARILAAGASDVLTMPVHPEEFAERLRGHLRLSRGKPSVSRSRLVWRL